MSNRAWMPLHIDDYITDTDHLTATEHGAYLLLIMKYWRDGGLPSDEGMIRRYAKLTPDQWAESRDVIAAFFDDGWRHGRIDAELSKADDIIEKRRAAGQAKNRKNTSSANAQHVLSNTDSICGDTGAIPLTSDLSSLRSDQIEKETRERGEFVDWFNSWPSAASDDDEDAFAAWRDLSPTDRSEAVAKSAAYVEAAKGGGRTAICSAAKYLRKRMWTRLAKLKPPDKPPAPKAATNGLSHLQNFQSREDYLAAERARSERSFR